MLEKHPHMFEPRPDAVLWRFTDFTKFVSLLDTSALYFTQAKRMADNYEGIFSKPLVENSLEIFGQMFPHKPERAKEMPKIISDLLRNSCYLSCWHKNAHESAAMWKLYLASCEGV